MPQEDQTTSEPIPKPESKPAAEPPPDNSRANSEWIRKEELPEGLQGNVRRDR